MFSVKWEGSDAAEEHFEDAEHDRSGPSETARPSTPPPAIPPSETEDDTDSEDEYVAEPEKFKGKASSSAKVRVHMSSSVSLPSDALYFIRQRRTRRVSMSSESDAPAPANVRGSTGPRETSRNAGPSRGSSARKASPATGSNLKRKGSVTQPPVPKRRKSSDDTPAEDVARKYCLGKLHELFCSIFLRYPHAPVTETGDRPELKEGELSDEDKTRLEEEAKVFTAELEQCIFDIYSEPDKHGKPSVGPKYK